jgi:hypothetical protein
MGSACGTYRGVDKFVQVLVRKFVGKRTHGRPSGGWETTLKLILNNTVSDINRILKK